MDVVKRLSAAEPVFSWVMAECHNHYHTPDISASIAHIFGDVRGALFKEKPDYVPREDGPQSAQHLYAAWRRGGVIKSIPVSTVKALYSLVTNEDPLQVKRNTIVDGNVQLEKDKTPLPWNAYLECVKICALFFPEKLKADITSDQFKSAALFHFEQYYGFYDSGRGLGINKEIYDADIKNLHRDCQEIWRSQAQTAGIQENVPS